MSTVPFCTSGMRFCEVTGWYFDFQLLAGGLLEVGQDALADLDVVARVLAVTQGVRQRARRVAHAHRDDARGLDLGNGVVRLGERAAGGQGRNRESQ